MNIIVHKPTSQAKQDELVKLAAKVHSRQIARYLNKLSCPIEQKKQLIDAVAYTIRQRSQNTSAKSDT